VVDHRDLDPGLTSSFSLLGEVLIGAARAQDIGRHQQHHADTISHATEPRNRD